MFSTWVIKTRVGILIHHAEIVTRTNSRVARLEVI